MYKINIKIIEISSAIIIIKDNINSKAIVTKTIIIIIIGIETIISIITITTIKMIITEIKAKIIINNLIIIKDLIIKDKIVTITITKEITINSNQI